METVTISSKYRGVIPSRVRRLLGVKPGQKVKVIMYDKRIELRGFLKGIDTGVEREPVEPERNCLHHPSDV